MGKLFGASAAVLMVACIAGWAASARMQDIPLDDLSAQFGRTAGLEALAEQMGRGALTQGREAIDDPLSDNPIAFYSGLGPSSP
jgi:hypothetical protein